MRGGGGGRGGGTLLTPLRTIFSFIHPLFQMFLERFLNRPTASPFHCCPHAVHQPCPSPIKLLIVHQYLQQFTKVSHMKHKQTSALPTPYDCSSKQNLSKHFIKPNCYCSYHCVKIYKREGRSTCCVIVNFVFCVFSLIFFFYVDLKFSKCSPISTSENSLSHSTGVYVVWYNNTRPYLLLHPLKNT